MSLTLDSRLARAVAPWLLCLAALHWVRGGPENFLRQLDPARLSEKVAAAWSVLGDPRSGEAEALPPPVADALGFLRARHAEDYRLSAAYAADSLIYQRITEASYPLRLDPKSRQLLALPGEAPPAGCKVLERSAHVALLGCD